MQELNKIVSVIIPIYNGEKHLEETLNAVSSSHYRNLQIILVDDGSKDSSGLIGRRYSETDRRVVYIEQKNKGIAEARNIGLRYAEGDFICFCDQDDLVSPKMYETLLERIRATDSDMAMCSTGVFEKKVFEKYKLKAGVYERQDVIQKFLEPLLFYNTLKKNSYIQQWDVWCAMYRKSIIKKNNIYFKKFLDYEDDWLFMIDYLLCSNRICTVEDVLYLWRYNYFSESHRKKYVEEYLKKQMNFENYIREVYCKVSSSEEKIKKYLQYKENIILMQALDNELCNSVAIQEKNRNFRRTAENVYRFFGISEKVTDIPKRARIYKRLLSHGMFHIAFIFGFLSYNFSTSNAVRRVKNRIRFTENLSNYL